MKKTRLYSILLVLTLVFQAGCSPPGVLYLDPGRYLEPVIYEQDSAEIVLEKFLESFNVDESIGQHFIGRRLQFLRMKSGLVSDNVDTLLGDRFLNNNVPFRRGGGWSHDLAGLQRYDSRARLVIGGDITKFSLQVTTDMTRVTSTLDISMDVDCLVGFVDEGKIVRKTVHVGKKVLKFSANQKAMEKVVDSFLADVVAQVYKNIEEFVQ